MELSSEGRYKLKGKYRIIDGETLEVTELPVGTWTQNYKEFLEGLLQTFSDGMLKQL